MNNERMLEKMNTALNILDSVRLELIKEDTETTKKKKEKVKKADAEKLKETGELAREYNIKKVLEKYHQPTDDEHVESICKIVENNNISKEQLDACIERVFKANIKEPKKNIKKYTYSCLYKI